MSVCLAVYLSTQGAATSELVCLSVCQHRGQLPVSLYVFLSVCHHKRQLPVILSVCLLAWMFAFCLSLSPQEALEIYVQCALLHDKMVCIIVVHCLQPKVSYD